MTALVPLVPARGTSTRIRCSVSDGFKASGLERGGVSAQNDRRCSVHTQGLGEQRARASDIGLRREGGAGAEPWPSQHLRFVNYSY